MTNPNLGNLADPKHTIRWYVWSGGEKLLHTSRMRGSWPGWDVECSCGWGSHTGGAIKTRVEEARLEHLGAVDWYRRGLTDEDGLLTDAGRAYAKELEEWRVQFLKERGL